MDFIKRTFPLLFGIFMISVLVRLPELNRPLSGHHEFCTAISLRVMQIWYDNGIENYGGNPVMSYNNPADKYINNSANASGQMIDSSGNYYYVSHPPFAYYFPFFIFKALHIRPGVLPLQILNLIFHFISGLFVYFIVCLLSFNRARSLPYRPAVVAFVVYTFLPITMWFQGNVYMADMAVHLLFVIGVYTALKMIIRQKFYSPKYILLYTLCLALMFYTSWLGVFFAFGILVYSLLHVRSNKGFNVLIWTTLITGVLMLRLIVYQYSQINGVEAYLVEMFNRYIQRGSIEEPRHGLLHFMFAYLWLFKTLLYNYLIHYIVVYIILGLFVYLAASHKKLKIVFSENGYRFIWLSVLPVLLLHFFLLNYSVQDFTALYASLFFSVLLGILYDKVKKSGAVPVRALQAGLAITVIIFIAQYQVMNYRTNIHYAQTVGQDIIAKNAGKNDVVFWPKDDVEPHFADLEPQLVLYAHRNIRVTQNAATAKDFLKQHGLKQGIIFTVFPRGYNMEKVNVDSVNSNIINNNKW